RNPAPLRGRSPRSPPGSRCRQRADEIRVRDPLAPEAAALELRLERAAVVDAPVVALPPRATRSSRAYEERSAWTQDAPQLLEAPLDLPFGHVLEHVVQHGRVEGLVIEGQVGYGGDRKLRLRHPLTRELDRLGAHVDSRR